MIGWRMEGGPTLEVDYHGPWTRYRSDVGRFVSHPRPLHEPMVHRGGPSDPVTDLVLLTEIRHSESNYIQLSYSKVLLN